MAEPRGSALPLEHELGAFRITQVLGQGGFGITYKAMDQRLQREVAIKEYLPRQFAYRGEGSTVLPREENDRELFEWGLNRFIDEARTLARFRHPNIVAVLSYFEGNGTAYLVMEYEEGRDFEAWLDLRPEGVAEDVLVHRILLPVLDGLEKVHEKGLLHRDIKPENIFMRRDGTPVLIDFGASRAHGQDTTAKLTTLYSAGYSPFEQYGGVSRQGPWTDLYALAGTLYRVIAGRKPTDALARQQGEALIPAVEAGRGRYSRTFLSAIDCALALDPKQRPQTAAAFRNMVRKSPSLVAVADSGVETLVRSRQIRTGPAKRFRGPLWWGLGAIGVVVAVGGLVVMQSYWRQQPSPGPEPTPGPQTNSQVPDNVEQPAETIPVPGGQQASSKVEKPDKTAPVPVAQRESPKVEPAGKRSPVSENSEPTESAEVEQSVLAGTQGPTQTPPDIYETPPETKMPPGSKPESKGANGAADIFSTLGMVAAEVLKDKEDREREAAARHYEQLAETAPAVQRAGPPVPNQQPQYIIRCVFPNDPNSYFVTAANEIISFSPNGQGTLIGRRIAPTVAGYEWMYQTASFTYGVVNGRIYAAGSDGRPYQVGHLTSP